MRAALSIRLLAPSRVPVFSRVPVSSLVSSLVPALLLALALAAPVTAQPAAGKDETPRTLSLAERLTQVDEQLAAAQQPLEQDRAGLLPVPAGATAAQLAERTRLLQRIAGQLRAQRDVLGELAAARTARDAARETLRADRSAPPAAPVALTDLDALLDRLEVERTRLSSYQSVLATQRDELQRAEALLKERSAAERLAADRAADPATAELARLQTRAAAENLRRQVVEAELTEELQAVAQARAALLERQAAAIGNRFAFGTQELEAVLAPLRAQRLALERRAEQAGTAQQAARERAELARAELTAAAGAGAEAGARGLAAQARLDAVEAQIEALRLEQNALSTLRGGVTLVEALWQQRYRLLNAADAEGRRAAGRALNELFGRAEALRGYASDLALLANSLAQAQQQRSERAQREGSVAAEQQEALGLAQRAAARAGEVQTLAERLAAAQARWLRQSEEVAAERSVQARAADAWAQLRHAARTAWNFELFSVTDQVSVDGRSTTVERGVTVGKSIGVVVLFVGGLWLASFVLRRLERLAVGRAGISASQARVLRRWSMLLLGFLLLVLTLNLARIPLTVFAFMGGALAIGVGFGTQTLLKNFISGIIVLFERKVRVGDLVDVEGVQGVVTAVDIRSTTVRQFDGIETLVPNAMLLENKVTNWTGESPVMRRVVRIGVAYGSPTRRVADILQQTAAEHGQVLDEPAPYVLFEDFGADALVFALFFWVDVVKHSGAQVQSDIRFMLDKRLADAGINIAYPQRDLHLDTARPLQIELLRRPAAT